MTSQHITDPATEALTPIGAPERPPMADIIGRYHARIERLDAAGLAHGEVVRQFSRRTGQRQRRAESNPPRHWSISPSSARCPVRSSRSRRAGGSPGRGGARKRLKPPMLRVTRVIEAAPERVAAPCPVFGVCGGCQLQHMDYAAQLAWKTERMRSLLAEAGFANASVQDTIGCNPPWNYRNHMRFSVDRAGRVGLTARGTSRVLPLTRCDIAARTHQRRAGCPRAPRAATTSGARALRRWHRTDVAPACAVRGAARGFRGARRRVARAGVRGGAGGTALPHPPQLVLPDEHRAGERHGASRAGGVTIWRRHHAGGRLLRRGNLRAADG